ncbi:hypothetical protein J3R82DRAFT_10359 [Butyriboletus roseoflavus]|nr:hypothetical protein J3R82DRAFT_10359 [Butyriboletus roseoflavus]
MPTSSLVGRDDSSSLSRYTNASTNVQANTIGLLTAPIGSLQCAESISIDISQYRPVKRRKVAGLNARFDRMIKSVDTMLSYRATSRERMQSSGTSSVSSHDVPKTPVDAYSNLHPGNLGKSFSVLKMKKSPLLPREDSDGCPKPAEPKEPRNPLPDWLANTFCSLEAGHPLRGLLSHSRINTEPKSNSAAQQLDISHEEVLFAFSPFQFDKQEQVPDAAYRAESTLNVQGNVSSIVPTLSHLQPEASTNVLPFSTPGCFAPVRRSTEHAVVDATLQKPLVPVPQQLTSHAINMMHPPALPVSHLRPDNEIELPQLTRAFSGLVQDNEPPSDFQEHGAWISHNHQVFRGGDDNLNVYATPGPTYAYSLPVYFDSPTEDPSLSDPLKPESYGLDLNAIGFRWRPFLRSNTQENDTNRPFVSPSPPLGYPVPNQVGDQNGCGARFPVDQREYGASSNEPSSLAEDLEIAYLNDVGAILPSNMNTSTINNLIRPCLSPINDVQQVLPAFAMAPGIILSPLRDQPESALLAADSDPPRGDGENIHTNEELSSVSEWQTNLQARCICDFLWTIPVVPRSCMAKK